MEKKRTAIAKQVQKHKDIRETILGALSKAERPNLGMVDTAITVETALDLAGYIITKRRAAKVTWIVTGDGGGHWSR